jgi:hypothetical protein
MTEGKLNLMEAYGTTRITRKLKPHKHFDIFFQESTYLKHFYISFVRAFPDCPASGLRQLLISIPETHGFTEFP